MAIFTDRTGEIHYNKEGYMIEIIKYLGVYNCTIRFEDGHTMTNVRYSSIKYGRVKSPYNPTVYGVGYLGVGKYIISLERKSTKVYNTWKGIIERGYDENWHTRQPTYKGCTVSDQWKCFQVFAEWFEENYKEGYALDKDILQKGNKIYSPETCCFVPSEVNTLFVKCNSARGSLPIGVVVVGKRYRANLHRDGNHNYLGTYDTPEEAFQAYKIAKEDYIKEVADKWRGRITESTYEAMYNYQVEITD